MEMVNNQPMKKKNIVKDIAPVAIGELAVALLVSLVAFVLGVAKVITFDYRIITGALLGAAVMIANYAWLAFSVDNHIDSFISKRGDREMDEEEAEEYAKANSRSIQKAIALSSTVRTVSMLVTLVLAFLLDWFNPIATAIPLFAFRFLLPVINQVISKDDKTPDPSKFIKYEDEEDNTDEKKEDN